MTAKNLAITSILLSLSTFAALPAAHAESIELGKLECYVDEGSGFIFGSTKDISCVFSPTGNSEFTDNYFGVINKYGIDIGKTEQSTITWLVVAASRTDFQPGFLEGDYAGASAEATFAVGLGANALIGGSEKSFALQPLSIQTQKGFNLAAGIAEIELRSISN
ncbi:MAG: DUF992 domain-containing protein [Rhizobiaceae bacterium]|nr:DUF992 domain-containing protein [Rhizobiaceae bacterium]